MTNHLKIMTLILSLTLGHDAFSSCENYQRLFGKIDLATKKFKTNTIDKTQEKICGSLPELPNANLKVSLKKKNKKFVTKMYRSLDGYWDHMDAKGNMTGGKTQLKNIEINLLIPSWYKGSTLTINDLKTGKKISEVKL